MDINEQDIQAEILLNQIWRMLQNKGIEVADSRRRIPQNIKFTVGVSPEQRRLLMSHIARQSPERKCFLGENGKTIFGWPMVEVILPIVTIGEILD